MMQAVAPYVRNLDPRLKLAVALVLGPCLWKISVVFAFLCALVLFAILKPLAASQPVGPKMVRSLVFYVLLWVGIKIVLDSLTGVPLTLAAMAAFDLAVRLSALLLLGLTLALSTSARALGLAVAWAVSPLVGKERAWRLALSLALMIHFLPLCLSTMANVKEMVSRRCPGYGFWQRLLIIPQVVIRNMGQKTWNQTLAVAGRGLEGAEAWEPEFVWTGHDWLWAIVALLFIVLMLLA